MEKEKYIPAERLGPPRFQQQIASSKEVTQMKYGFVNVNLRGLLDDVRVHF